MAILKSHRFYSIHAQEMVRVAATTPRATVGEPAANADAAIDLVKKAAASGVDLIVFPELNMSSYAIDDLHMQAAQHQATEAAIARLAKATAKFATVMLVGAAIPRNGRLYNCAIAIARGKILGVVPKTFLPNYREFYEKRWFASGAGLTGMEIDLAGQRVPFGTDLIFAASDLPHFVFHAEICEDFWSPTPPSTMGALAGAYICCNLSASPILIGKARDRAMLASAQSSRAICAYVFSASGPGESTNDLAWDGQSLIYENGDLLKESQRFRCEADTIVADIDVARLRIERMRNGTFNDAARLAGDPEYEFRRISFDHKPDFADIGLKRDVRRFPFAPDTPERLDADCYEAFNIQVEGLMKRIEAAHAKRLVIGISGGLDSTHALIVAVKAADRMKMPRDHILGYTMPGFATSDGTKANAWALMRALGIAGDEIDIRPAANQMLADMHHPYALGEKHYDVTFENVQAGLRTDYLFRLANQHQGLVIGTGDLSELALGWCTYGVGDHMSHYGVNAGVPKTLIQYLIRWTIATDFWDLETARVLDAILATEISPELVPAGADGIIQSTEARIGPYELHDFFLHYTIRQGQLPSKIAFLAWHAWKDADAGRWPVGFPVLGRHAYDLATIRKWLEEFLYRFFQTSQFKRSALPNGPKVSGGGALSPRGDWRAPSDGVATVWLEELRANCP
ncbi:glutamine-dependent NAD(+) synthetase [Sphingomonas sp. 28-63-12]|uniref:NAD(+) synthase n=1 Tax=Sphingomonas sp. 28-63-12 TaxID=1970434 RepID=UPI000BC51082|nr:MAG: NAD(+) synthase [Sphingomonas sp. 28-63-12]